MLEIVGTIACASSISHAKGLLAVARGVGAIFGAWVLHGISGVISKTLDRGAQGGQSEKREFHVVSMIRC